MSESERQALMIELMREAGLSNPEDWPLAQSQAFAYALVYLYREVKALKAHALGETDGNG